MTRRDLLFPIVLACLSLGCSESTGPDTSEAIHAGAITPLAVTGLPDGSVSELPAVRVYRLSDNRAIEGRTVLFVLEGPDGVGTTVPVATDAAGVARLPAWQPGPRGGRYTATAIMEGIPPIVFTAVVRGGVVAVFDLLSIDGLPLPYGLGVTEGHYVLFEDGSYNRGYNRSAEALNEEGSFGRYTWTGIEIRFFIDPASRGGWNYAPSNYQFSHGFLIGDRIKLGHTNYLDFGDEVYQLRPRPGSQGAL